MMYLKATSQNFSIRVLEDPFALQRFLSGEDAFGSIQRFVTPPKNTLYFGRFQVTWILIKSPFLWLFSCLTATFAHASKCLGFAQTSRVFSVLTQQCSREYTQLIHQWTWGKKLLVPSFNTHQTCTWDFYGAGTLPAAAIKSQELKEIAYQMDFIRLYSEAGVCRGASFWFINCFLKTKDLFENGEKHLMAVASLFTSGIPREASFLHAMHKNASLLQLSFEDLESKDYEFEDLPSGIYRVGMPDHSMVHVKLEDGSSYGWDPEFGLLKLTPDELDEMICTYYKEASYLQCFSFFETTGDVEESA